MNLNDLVRGTLYDRRKNVQAGRFGVEVEVETDRELEPSMDVNKVWHLVHDGSLRGAHSGEFVLRTPMDLQETKDAVHDLSGWFRDSGTDIQDTVRAGVHIHVNMQDRTLRGLFTFLTAYYILEEILVDRCGEGRSGNHFCLRAKDSDQVIFGLAEALREGEISLVNARLGGLRYLALNIDSLYKFGSLEFRAIRTPPSLDDIVVWLDVLNNILTNCELYQDPRQMVENISFGGEEIFFRNILGNTVDYFAEVPNIREKIQNGVKMAQEISYSRQEW
jgi:hypothetical protein